MDLIPQIDRRSGKDRRNKPRASTSDRRAGSDRRGGTRYRPTTICPAFTPTDGHQRIALLSDVSARGARFRAPEFGERMNLLQQETREMELHTPYGTSVCKGCVCWQQHDQHYCTFGVKFEGNGKNLPQKFRELMK